MAKFQYRMQSILNVKIKLENQAKQEYGTAKAALDTEIEKLDTLFERKKRYEEKAEELLQGDLRIREINDNKSAILRMDEYIVEQKKEIKKAEDKLEEARLKLQGLVQERKMHEKLKEHAFEAFLEEVKHTEGKEVDELTSYTYGQKAKKAESKLGKGEDLDGK